jgi:hypothetical protein
MDLNPQTTSIEPEPPKQSSKHGKTPKTNAAPISQHAKVSDPSHGSES